MKERLKRNKLYLIVMGVLLVVLIVLGVVSNTSNLFSNIKLMTHVQCYYDKGVFLSDTCPNCGRDILEAGYFYYDELTYEYDYEDGGKERTAFSDYYENYADFEADYNFALCISVIFIICLVLFIVWIIFGRKIIRRFSKK